MVTFENADIILELRDSVTQLKTMLSERSESDETSHEAILKEIGHLEEVVKIRLEAHVNSYEAKHQSNVARIEKLESNQAKLIWLVIAVVVTAVLGTVIAPNWIAP